MKIFFFAFIFVFSQIVLAQNNSRKGLAVYLLPENIKPAQLSNLDLKKLRPTGRPLIDESEILYYRKETHEFRIEYTAADRLKKINDGGGTRTFAIFVGDEAIYTGAFWKSILSQSFDGIVIDTMKAVGKPPYYSNTDFPALALETGYPSPNFFKGPDLRADPRILKSLETAGKLYDELELVVKCKKIVATGKRRPSSVFTFDVVSVTKGEFNEKEIKIELFDGKLLPELGSELGFEVGQSLKFNPETEIILSFSKQVGKEHPDRFLNGFRKK